MTDRLGPGSPPHEDVAAYALGALDDAEATRFEEHLVSCDACASRLEDFLPVVDLLPEVPLSTVDLPPRPIDMDVDDDLKARHRQRAGRRMPPAPVRSIVSGTRAGLRRPAVAAAAAAVAACAVTAGVFGGFAYDEIVTTTSAGAPASASAPWNGLGGPDLDHGRRLSATDTASGVTADVVLDKVQWGTRVSFALSRLQGPQECRLVLVRRDGGTEVLSSWVVPPQGYGDGKSRPLVLQAATAVDQADIAALRVEVVGSAKARPLVTVPA